MTGRLRLCAYALGMGGLLLPESAAAGLMWQGRQNRHAAQTQAQAAGSNTARPTLSAWREASARCARWTRWAPERSKAVPEMRYSTPLAEALT